MHTEINWYLMALVFFIFLVTMYLLNIWLFRPLLSFVHKRNEAIEQDIREINDSASEIERIEKEVSEILENARREARLMVEKSQSESRALYEARILKYSLENQARIDEFMESIKAEKIRLKDHILMDKEGLKDALNRKISRF